MQVKPGSSLLQALSGAIQSSTSKPQRNEAGPVAIEAGPKQPRPLQVLANVPLGNMNIHAPRGTYLNILV